MDKCKLDHKNVTIVHCSAFRQALLNGLPYIHEAKARGVPKHAGPSSQYYAVLVLKKTY